MNSTAIASQQQSPLPAPMKTREKLSREEINSLPLFHYEGRINLARSMEDVEEAVEALSREPVLGFDTETPPSFRKGKSYSPTLVQLAGAHEVWLFHLKWQPLGDGLISLFENPDIIKTGVAVHDDMRFLSKITPFTARSVVDLSEIARRNKVENRGLRGLAAAFLGLRISKGEQCSSWGNSELSARQIRYAATDAWASRAVYLSMVEAGLDFDVDTTPQPSRGKRVPRSSQPQRRGKRPPRPAR